MGRTGGRQAHIADGISVDVSQHMPLETFLRFRPVEKYPSDTPVRAEKRAKIVGNLRFPLDPRIQAAFTRAGLQDVPNRNARRLQGLNLPLIGSDRIEPEKFADDAPEGILGMRVVLTGRERSPSRHAAEDEHLGILVFDWVEAADL